MLALIVPPNHLSRQLSHPHFIDEDSVASETALGTEAERPQALAVSPHHARLQLLSQYAVAVGTGALEASRPVGPPCQCPRAGPFEKAGPGIHLRGSVKSRVTENVPGRINSLMKALRSGRAGLRN